MKRIRFISTGVLLLLLGTIVPTYAMQEQHEQEAKPEKQEQQAKPEKQQQQKAPQQAKLAPQQETQQSRPNGGNSGGGAHGRISDDHYRASFGDSHRFHVNEGEFRNHRFQYGGYSFGFIDPWPEGWLYTDDVYIVYVDGGYYMFDAFHPGIRIAINII